LIRSSQHGLAEGKSSLTNLRAFYNNVMTLVDAGRAVNVDCLDFSKAFDTLCHNILMDKLTKYKLNKCTVGWTENWLSSWTQSAVISGIKSTQKPVTSCVLRF